MHDIARHRAFMLQSRLQVVQVFKILNVLAFSIDQFLDDVVAIGHLRVWGSQCLIFGVRLALNEEPSLFCEVKDIVDDLGYLIIVKIAIA